MNDHSGPIWTFSSHRRWRFHLWRGARSLESGDFGGARKHFAAAYREAPEEPLVCLAWGRELLRAGDPAAAEKLLRRAWSGDPALSTAGLQLARVLGLHRDQRLEAARVLDELQQEMGDIAPIRLLRAEIALADPPDFEAAKAHLERARDLGADERAVRVGLARAYNAEGVAQSRSGEHHQALFALKRAADLDPDWSGPLVNRGAIFEQLGQAHRAQKLYREALTLDPRNPVAIYNLADSLRRSGGRLESERLYRRLLSLQPGYPGGEAGLRRLLEQVPPPGESAPDPGLGPTE